MSFGHGDGLDQIPSYDEAVKSTSSASIPSHAERVRQLQSARIHTLLEDQILPFIESQVSQGLTHFSVILVPTDISELREHISSKMPMIVEKNVDGAQPPGQQEEILGFPDHETVKLLRLSDSEDTSKFWQQPLVMQKLETSLKDRLGIRDGQPSIDVPAVLPQRPARKGFWRKTSTSSSPWDENGVSSLGLAAKKKTAQSALAPGQMTAAVTLEEVSLQTVSDFDLFEVRNGSGIVVRVRIGL